MVRRVDKLRIAAYDASTVLVVVNSLYSPLFLDASGVFYREATGCREAGYRTIQREDESYVIEECQD